VEFTLFYRGDLKANRGAEDKHASRRHFHPQLKALGAQKPLSDFRTLLEPRSQNNGLSVLRSVGMHTFAPLVCEAVHLVAELRIDLLRPEAPGAKVTQGGDIDNRFKTLLDALKVPAQPNALPNGSTPDADEAPFYFLSEEDREPHMPTRPLNAARLGCEEDWVGNNAAFRCPHCGRVFLVSLAGDMAAASMSLPAHQPS
jgi:hypothetical protein